MKKPGSGRCTPPNVMRACHFCLPVLHRTPLKEMVKACSSTEEKKQWPHLRRSLLAFLAALELFKYHRGERKITKELTYRRRRWEKTNRPQEGKGKASDERRKKKEGAMGVALLVCFSRKRWE